MKRISIIITFIALPFLVNAQDFVDQLIEKYQGKSGFTTVVIHKNLFEFAAAIEDDEDLQKMKGMIDNIRIIALEDELNPEKVNFYEEIIGQVDKKSYQQLMSVKETDHDVIFYAKYAGKDIEEILLIAGGNHENAVISIKGKLNLKEMASLSRSVHMSGFEHFDALDNE
ncbi:MAG: DUF4252 domain-containing protein [Bacteroidales bacterium]|jgi:hypothetical protein|nr:DUF4252 domain-containing protein [Bacteroidales bacterium]